MRDVRLAELLAALSLAADLGNDFPAEKSLRTCVLALALGRELGLSREDIHDIYFAALMRFVGCAASAHELSQRFGDDNRVRGTMASVDRGHTEDRLRALRTLAHGRGLLGHARIAAAMVADGEQIFQRLAGADCEVSAHAALQIGVGSGTSAVLLHSFTRWDGRGAPRGVAGPAIDRRARVVQVASFADTHHRMGGRQAAIAAVARGAGGWFDPDIAATFVVRGGELLSALERDSVWQVVLEAEPRPFRCIDDAGIDALAQSFADLVDLKSIYRLGHSSGVAELATRAAGTIGMPANAVVTVRRAALLHDLGMYSVPTGILDKPGKLSASEWERVRLHAYHTERALARSPVLADVARVASLHHERLDGSGYHRSSRGAALPMTARLLAAADVFQALTESRPHRSALTLDAAAKSVEAEVARGALDSDAARAVCAAAGAPVARRRRTAGPAGLSEREVEILRLLARGRSNKEIGNALFIAPGTVHTHVTHLYEKLGVSSRAAAAILAMEHGLLPDEH